MKIFYTISVIFLLSVALTRSQEINVLMKTLAGSAGKVIDVFYLK